MTGKAEIRKNIASKNNKVSRNLNTNFNMTRGAPASRISHVVSKGGWIGSANTDLNMNTFDILSVDRLKFSTTTGSGDILTNSDTGIEAVYFNDLPYGMQIQIPSTNGAILTINRGALEIINISSVGTIINGHVYLGFAETDNIKITGRIHSSSSSEIGIYVTNATATVGTEGTLQIPYYTGSAPDSDATLNTKFGSINGSLGVWYDTNTTTNSRIYVRINSAWYHAFLTKSN